MVAVMGLPVELVAVNEGIFPLPLAPRPMVVLLLVHAKVAPVGVLVNVAAATVVPEHCVISAGTVTVGPVLTTTLCELTSVQPVEEVVVKEIR